jgi:bifunctional non-homologous end joining protein LigD
MHHEVEKILKWCTMQKKLFNEPHSIVVNRRRIELTHCSKLIFPHNGITKADLIDYYYAIAPHMIPLIKNHPITLLRYVNGIDEEGFYQKEAGTYFPDWITQAKVPKRSGGATHYVVVNNAASLIYLTNQLTVTYHAWLSTVDALNTPDKMIFDLDPAGNATFSDVKFVARVLHDYFAERNIKPLCMTTGSRGLHVIIPLKREHNFDTVRATARSIAQQCLAQHPNRITLEARLNKRDNKIYIDVLRNAYAATAVAPYSVRALPHAPVATPIRWEELFDGTIKKSTHFTIKTALQHAEHNPWHTITHYALKKIEPN